MVRPISRRCERKGDLMREVDLVGVGFGPSNISVAIAGLELQPGLRVEFHDAKSSFAWHPDLMFPEAEMQVSFLKDLVSMRNPRSAFSFLEYLRAKGRLPDFINLRTFYPSRTEFNDYYAWVADQFSDRVRWGSRVVGIVAAAGGRLDVTTRDETTGLEQTVRTKNLVVADGGTPYLPEGTATGDRLFHASESKRRLEQQFPDRLAPYRFNIVGAGQTTADLFVFLSSQYPEASITVSLRGFAMRPEDDTHFVNELFSPEMPDWFYSTSAEARALVLRDYASAAHSGASYDLIPRIYRTQYEARVVGSDRYRFDRLVQYVGGASTPEHAEVRYRSVEDGAERSERYDAVILATGYRYPTPLPLLQGAADLFETDDAGRYQLNRDYSVQTTDLNGPKVFLQGYAEATHGFSEVLLSLMPHRAAEIIESATEASASLGLPEPVA